MTEPVEHFRGAAGAARLEGDRHGARGRYLAALVRGPLRQYADNVGDVRMEVVAVGETLVPILLNDGGDTDCYLTSPIGYYVRYVRDEIPRLRQDAFTRVFDKVIAGLEHPLRWSSFNRVAYVNHWLMSTSPRVRFDRSSLEALTRHLEREYPTHTLVFRGLTRDETEHCSSFAAAGYELVVSRPIHVWSSDRRVESRDTRRQRVCDARAVERFVVGHEPSAHDLDAIPALYRRLYVEKYSRMNPAYTRAYFAHLLDSGWGAVTMLHSDGALVGFVTHAIDADGALLGLSVGHDPAVSQRDLPVYRALVSTLFQRAEREQRALFLSTGVSDFKRRRGAVELLEFDAVRAAHAPWPARAAWWTVGSAFDLAIQNIDTRQV